MIVRGSKRRALSNVRKTIRLAPGLERSLSAYASAAVAAGVSLLAMTKSVEAEVVYTPANISIPVNGSAVLVDLNHDGIADFAFWNLRFASDSTFRSSGRSALNLYAGCAPVGSTCRYPGNEIWGRGVGSRYGRFASALPAGVHVGPDKSYFQQGPKSKNGLVSSPVAKLANLGIFYSYQGYLAGSYTYGQWIYTQHRYLGLQFVIGGDVHYGWARVAVTVDRTQRNNKIVATLTGYAYETIPGKPIITGQTKGPDAVTLEPASLGHLAQGAAGISAWRESK
ncbi:MAG TPA: hypothetical protein VK763_20340 [Terriglobales bacterium]|jgi:hypothetical protein|nr:hypothetical protein [Terriglobales bacterium]